LRPLILSSFALLPLAASTCSHALAQENSVPLSSSPLSVVAPIVVPVSGSETVTAEPEVTLDELLRRALATNPSLAVSREEQEAAAQRAQAARSRLSPALQIVPRIIGPANAASEEIILSQPVDFFGQRRARSRVAQAELRRTEAASTLALRTLTVQVRGAATDLFAAQEAEALGEVQVEVATQFRDAAARRAQLGDVPPVQAQRAALELLRAENELTGTRAERLARRAVLNQLTGSPPEAPLRVALPLDPSATALLRSLPSSPRFPLSGVAGGQTGAVGGEAGAASGQASTPSTSGALAAGGDAGAEGNIPSVTLPSAATANSAGANGITSGTTSQTPLILGASSQIGSDLVAARSNLSAGLGLRPDIVGAQATLEAREAQVQVLRASRRPQVEFQVRRNAVFANSRAAAEAVGPIGTALRAVVTVPLGSGASRGEQRALEAEVRAQQAQINLLRSQAGAQLEGALIRLQQQREMVERYRRPVTGILPQTIDLLRKTQIGFAAGASTYLEVLEAQRTTRQVQTEYLQALVGAQTQQIALESVLGSNLPSSLSGTLVNPSGATAPPNVAAPGTVQPGIIPPVNSGPLNPPGLNLPGTLPPTDTRGGTNQ
jgi:outer membrane protein TolC